MKRRCSLRLDLLPGESNPAWQVFDRLTGTNGGLARTIPLSHSIDPGNIIETFNHDIIKSLNDSSHPISVASIRAWGRNFCTAIFPDEIQHRLSACESGDLLFMVPLHWADLPFEILCLPTGFLGERFQIGTIINAGKPQGSEKQYNHEGDMVIIADPSDSLQSAGREGERLKTLAVKRKRSVRLLMKTDNLKLIAKIPEASIVHFAGHSGPDAENDIVGWELGNGKYFTTGDIDKIGAEPVLPWLVFSNSCDGGRIVVNTGLSGIAGAFLSAGVHQVIGPFCKLNDQQAGLCTRSFYNYLFQGKSAAHALTSLRKNRPDGAGITPLFYRLFGDPRYKEPDQKRLRDKIVRRLIVIMFFLSLLGAGANWIHDKVAKMGAAANRSIDKRPQGSGEVAVDLTIGGIIRFSVNLYAPTFIDNGHQSNQQTERTIDAATNPDDTAASQRK